MMSYVHEDQTVYNEDASFSPHGALSHWFSYQNEREHSAMQCLEQLTVLECAEPTNALVY